MLQLVCTRVCVCVCVCVCVYWRWQDGEYYGEELDRKYRASIVAQLVKSPPAMLETWVRSLGWEDSLEKGKAIHSSVLAWRIPWTFSREELDTTEGLSL